MKSLRNNSKFSNLSEIFISFKVKFPCIKNWTRRKKNRKKKRKLLMTAPYGRP
jgi:hypothetical protein